jgi:hypothetical protein
LHATEGLRSIIDEIAEAKNLIRIGLRFEHGLEGRPVGMDIGYDQELHDYHYRPKNFWFVGVISPWAFLPAFLAGTGKLHCRVKLSVGQR